MKRICIARTTGPHWITRDGGSTYWSDCLQVFEIPDNIPEGELVRIRDGKVERVCGEDIFSVGKAEDEFRRQLTSWVDK